MKTWQELYRMYESGEMQERYDKLKQKIEEKKATKEEYEEYRKMEKIFGNLSKVGNILKYKEELEKHKKKLKAELDARKNSSEETKKRQELESKLEQNLNRQNAIMARQKELRRIIRENSSNKAIVASVNNELAEISEELGGLKVARDKNNEEYVKINHTSKNKKLNQFSNEEIEKYCFDISSIISKCNFIGRVMMDGGSIDTVKVKLDRWREKKFTSKSKIPIENKNTNSQPLLPNVVSPVVVSDFEKTYPRLSKITKKIVPEFIRKSRLGKLAEKIALGLKKEKNEEQKEEIKKVIETKTRRQQFMNDIQYDIIEVAEKGIDNMRRERLNEIRRKQAEKSEKNEVESPESIIMPDPPNGYSEIEGEELGK